MKKIGIIIFFMIPLVGFAQKPSNPVSNVSVSKLLNRYIIIFKYQVGSSSSGGVNIADSFLVQLHNVTNVCTPTNCLPATGQYFKPSGTKTVNYSDFQNVTCGANTLRCLKFKMKSVSLGGQIFDTVIINCVDNINLGCILYSCKGSNYNTPNSGPNCTNPSGIQFWTVPTATVQVDSTPSTQVSNLSITNLDTSSFTINWRNSFSDSVVVFGKTDPASTVTFTNPTNGTDYSTGATGNYPSAPTTGPGGWSVYYSGANTNPGGNQSLNLYNIPQSKTNRFHFRVLAYNKDVASPCASGLAVNNAYFTTTVPGIFTKLYPSPPSDTITSFSLDAFDSVSVTVSFNLPDCDSFMLVYSPSSFPNFLPSGFYNCSTDSNSVTVASNYDTLRNSGFRVIFKGGGYVGQSKSLTIGGLTADKYAYFTLFTFNSNGQGFENYNENSQNLRAFTDATYPNNCPIYQGSNSSITNNGGLNFFDYTIAWDRGINTSRTLVVLSQNGPITGIPGEKREYQASDQFGLGDQIAPGEYVVYKDTGTFVLVTDVPRLGPSTPIYFKLFSFNGTKISQVNPDSANTYYNIYCTADSFLLPIELKSISANTEGDSVVFQWVTAMEKNNSGFQIQLSTNSKNWSNLSFIPGKGNTFNESHYRWKHSLLSLPQRFFLRYQQIDFDGRTSYSPIFTINNTSNYQPWNYSESMGLTHLAKISGNLSYKILDGQGKTISSNQIKTEKNQSIQLPTDFLNPGIYFIQATLNNLPSQFKFVKQP